MLCNHCQLLKSSLREQECFAKRVSNALTQPCYPKTLLQVNHSRESSLGLWVTDVAACANVGLVAISSTEREISE